MDDLDLRILAALDVDARRSYTGIAKELDVATATVHQRMKRLVERGVIKGFRIDIDWEQVGLPVSAVVSISSRSARSLREIADDLSGIPHVVTCAAVTGEFDLYATVRAETPDHLGDVIDQIRRATDGTTRTVLVLTPYFVGRTPPLTDGDGAG